MNISQARFVPDRIFRKYEKNAGLTNPDFYPAEPDVRRPWKKLLTRIAPDILRHSKIFPVVVLGGGGKE